MVFDVDFAVSGLNWIQTVRHSDGIPEKRNSRQQQQKWQKSTQHSKP